MQTTLSPILLAYVSMTNQSPENHLTQKLKLLLRGQAYSIAEKKPLLQKLEQITLTSKLIFYGNSFTVLDYFHLYNVQTPVFLTVNSVIQSQHGRAATSAGREKTNPFA